MFDKFKKKRADISQRTTVTGDHNQIGSINQIGQQNHYYSHPPDEPQAPLDIDVKWSWKSPLTQARLAWLGVFLAIVPITSAYNLFKPVFDGSALSALGTPDVESKTDEQTIWILAFIIGLLLVLCVFSMWRVVHKRIHVFSPLSALPVASEYEGHFALARYKGTCRRCDGKLRFYNKAIAWETVPDGNGGTKRVVTEREPTAECCRNPKHRWPLDETETILS